MLPRPLPTREFPPILQRRKLRHSRAPSTPPPTHPDFGRQGGRIRAHRPNAAFCFLCSIWPWLGPWNLHGLQGQAPSIPTCPLGPRTFHQAQTCSPPQHADYHTCPGPPLGLPLAHLHLGPPSTPGPPINKRIPALLGCLFCSRYSSKYVTCSQPPSEVGYR